ncbi:PD-(D/E)XK nuclease family protein [Actinocorallia longicatena]|uniref:PD-(D/E)XK nuclease family protein n=1 Tax=Actinocorallia longicatena TaxID=111803 RepID=A0ABP6QIL3_9ACTN
MEQLGLEGMPRRLYSCTPSRLNNWLDCPRRYRMTYLDRPMPSKGLPWAHNSMGAAVHNALAAWWRLPVADRTAAPAGTLLSRGWLTDGFRDGEQSAAWRERARVMVEDYAAALDPLDEPAGVERTVATKTEVIAVSGRIDRLDDRGAELAVVDYKTGRRPLTSDDARGSLALALYAIASSRVLRKPCHTVELHHLPTGTVASWRHTDESLARHLGRAEAIAAECADADDAYRTKIPKPRRPVDAPPDHAPYDEVFPPSTGPLCGWCDFARHCPEGQAATTRREPWAALDDHPAVT